MILFCDEFFSCNDAFSEKLEELLSWLFMKVRQTRESWGGGFADLVIGYGAPNEPTSLIRSLTPNPLRSFLDQKNT